jgi:lysophospholipase L1-like esterase
MLRRIWLCAALSAGLATPVWAQSCPAIGPGGPPLEAVAAPNGDPNWQKREADLEAQIASTDLSKVRMLFLGDSLTEGWEPVLYDHFYAHRAPLNFGDRGDTTQGLLWRLARIPLGTSLRPQLVVLLIGTNDLWPGANPINVATGVTEVVRQIRTRSPQSRILLVGLLPRGEAPDDPFRAQRLMVNALLAQCTDSMVTFADPGGMLLDGAGRLTKDFSYDRLHLTWIGYAILGAGLEPYIKQALGG